MENAKEICETQNWDYEKSVATAKDRFQKWGKLTLELVRDLFIAQQELGNSGYRTELTSCQNGTRFQTFENYLQEVGIKKRTAYNWLFLYDCENDRLLEPEEARSRRDQMLEQVFQEIQRHSKKDPAWRPPDWSAPLEKAYHKWLGGLKVLASIEQDGYRQAELFSRENLRILAMQMQEDPSPEEILYQAELCRRYERLAAPAVKVQDQVSIARIVEKAVDMFPPESRIPVARSVAQIIMDMSLKKEEKQ